MKPDRDRVAFAAGTAAGAALVATLLRMLMDTSIEVAELVSLYLVSAVVLYLSWPLVDRARKRRS